MRLHPRHYVLIGILLLLGVWNLLRLRRGLNPSTAPVASTPGWQAFDHAARLKDSPEAEFSPALNALRAQTESATGPEASDLRGCQMWLMYYRHSIAAASGKSGDWAMMASSHVQTCASSHHDVGR